MDQPQHFLALATDYDGTIAESGAVAPETLDALERLRDSGRRLVLVTGRELADLQRAFSRLELFERVVLENGGVVFNPTTGEEQAIAPPPPPELVHELMRRGIRPISVGRVVVATWEPHQREVLETIQALGLELKIVFNKGAVMVLPTGINKATGVDVALAEMDISPHNTVAVGDAENDHAFLRVCGCAAAVASAVPAIRQIADIRLEGGAGAGVIELVERIIAEDAQLVPASRSGLLAGCDRSAAPVHVAPEQAVLIAGSSGSGKSSFATALTERMIEARYEFCMLDPEGDYLGLRDAVVLGNQNTPPPPEDTMQFLLRANVNVVVNTQALGASRRVELFARLFPALRQLRRRSGRPHWTIIDEANHFLPAGTPCRAWAEGELGGTIFIAVDPKSVASEVLDRIGTVIAFGSAATEVIGRFAGAQGLSVPPGLPKPQAGECLVWPVRPPGEPHIVKVQAPRQIHNRHAGKYACGDVGEWNSFYFRGPDGRMDLRARNLAEFLRLSASADDAVWQHHLRAGDYSAWFRDVIHDDQLAADAAAVEANGRLTAAESREHIRRAVLARYSVPPDDTGVNEG